MDRGTRWTLGLALLLVPIGHLVWRWSAVEQSRQAVARPPAGSASRPDATDARLIAAAEALALRRIGEWKSTWPVEDEAQRHGEYFVLLWDALRAAARPSAILGNVPFERLDIPGASEATNLGDGIRRTLHDGLPRSFTPSDWRAAVARWDSDGWRLASSSWQHVRFDPPDQGLRARSTVEFELRLLRESVTPPGTVSRERVHMQGRALVDWAPPRPEAPDLPVPGLVTIGGLSRLERTGDPWFEPVLTEAFVPERRSPLIDPVLVLDLDGDGLDELLLAGRNRLYRNRGAMTFDVETLCPAWHGSILTAAAGDFDGDGVLDLLLAGTTGIQLMRGRSGGFPDPPAEQRFEGLLNPFVLVPGDVDGDGDLDVWLAQYKVPYRYGQMPTPFHDANDGFASFLLRNDGHGVFADATPGSGLAPKRFRRTYSASWVDIDDDGDLDLVNVSDFAGVELHLNDGSGRFVNATESAFPEWHLFGMSHAVVDLDGDERPDLFVAGMNSPTADRLNAWEKGGGEGVNWRRVMTEGNRAYVQSSGTALGVAGFRPAAGAGVLARSGWSWGVSAGDIDNDADIDIYVANGHKSHASVRDYEPEFWCHDILVGTSREDPVTRLYFDGKAARFEGQGVGYRGHERNVLFLNEGGGVWVDAGWLAGVDFPEDSRAVVTADLDNDGRMDLVTTTEERWPVEQSCLRVHRNVGPWPAAASIRLEPVAALHRGLRITAEAGRWRQTRWIVGGDSYRSQHPPVAHVAWPADLPTGGVRVIAPGGRELFRSELRRGERRRVRLEPARAGAR